MEIMDLVARQSVHDRALKEIAARIRPLPEDVVPAKRFREQLRLQLLQLDPVVRPASTSQAA